jgi:hypothetical protein
VTERDLGGRRPAGPFSVAEVQKYLRDTGWVADPAEPDEALVYRRPPSERTVVIDPDWPEMRWGSSVFRAITHDLGLTQDELAQRLRELRT